jgi:sterol desaturase/sphingolipid hydroxylase (fatty acid hydroxylase superfamily)
LPATGASTSSSAAFSTDPETGSAYILPNFIDRIVPFFLISIVVEFFVARAQVKRKREKLLAQRLAAAAQVQAASVAQQRQHHPLDSTDLSRTPAVVDVTPFDARDTEPYFRLNDSVNSISLGMLQQMLHVGGFVRPLIYAPYIWVYEQYAIIRLPITWWSWLLCFVLVELGYYW